MKIRFRLPDEEPREEHRPAPVHFALLEDRRPWTGLGISVVSHILLLVLGLPVLNEYLNLHQDALAGVRLEAEPLRIRLQEHLYFSRLSEPPKVVQEALKRLAAKKPQEKAQPAKPRMAEELRVTPPAPRRFAQRKFRLPDIPVTPRAEITLLQPQFPIDMKPAELPKLPTMLVWSPPRKPEAKALITPGHAQERAQAPLLDAPPGLVAPNWEIAVGDMLVGGFGRLPAPKLVLPQSNVMPVQVPNLPLPELSGEALSVDPLRGDPATVLVISQYKLPSEESVTVPPGNVMAEVDSPKAQDAAKELRLARGTDEVLPEGQQPPQAQGPAMGVEKPKEVAAAKGTHSELPAVKPALRTRTDAAKPAAVGRPDGQRREGEGSRTDPAAQPATAATGRPPATDVEGPEPPGKVVHPPKGSFDVVVIQSSIAEQGEEGSGILSGRPIYSVYLAVGESREWTMKYCVPEEPIQKSTGKTGVIQLGNPKPVTAPYPQLTYRPEKNLPAQGKHVLVHGFIDGAGMFRDLRLLGNSQAEGGLLPLLRRWRFRPAVRDGQAVEVEILLLVPAARS